MQRYWHLPQLSWQRCTITMLSIWKFSSRFSKNERRTKSYLNIFCIFAT